MPFPLFSVDELLEFDITTPIWDRRGGILTFQVPDLPRGSESRGLVESPPNTKSLMRIFGSASETPTSRKPRGVGHSQIQDRSNGRPPACWDRETLRGPVKAGISLRRRAEELYRARAVRPNRKFRLTS
jgi:hypothetical protein